MHAVVKETPMLFIKVYKDINNKESVSGIIKALSII